MDQILPSLFRGVSITVQVTVYAALLGTAMSILSGLASLSPWQPIRVASRVYVDFFRGTSAIVQLFWIFFALPLVGISLPPLTAGFVTLGLNMGSYGSEVVRGAIQAVPKGQREAAIALNLTSYQRMRYVIFRQAIVGMLPPYGNLLIELLKGTALVALITLPDITFEAQKLRANTNIQVGTPLIFGTVLVMYFALSLILTAMVRAAEAFFSRGLGIGSNVILPVHLRFIKGSVK